MKQLILLVMASVIFVSVQGCGLSTDIHGNGKYTEKTVVDSMWLSVRHDTVYLDIQDWGYFSGGVDSSTYEIRSLSGIRDSIHLFLTASTASSGNVIGADTSMQWRGDTLTINFWEKLASSIATKNPPFTNAKGVKSPEPLTTPKPEIFFITHITFELPTNHHVVMLDTRRWKLK